jgi:transcription initiation factor TFIIIB Brf1 subunit/transcription initiation factor TFIIB
VQKITKKNSKIVIKTMATYRALPNSTLSFDKSYLKCDICGSTDIVDTAEGYVCRACGIVLEIKKLQYDRPYSEELIQYAKGKGSTQIGTNRERRESPYSQKLYRLHKYNSITNSEEAIQKRAEIEIKRIFAELGLDEYDTVKKMVFEKFRQIRKKLRKGVKYRNPEKLIAVISHFCLKLRNVSVNACNLIELSKITKKEFNDFCFQVVKYLPEYQERNRMKYILNRVFEVSQHFKLGADFFDLARKILKKLWLSIKGTTDNVVAGLVCSISSLCSHRDEVTVSAICTRLGIRMSTIQAQVKKKIIQRFRVKGFVSLVRSSDLLVKIMKILGLFEPQDHEEQEIIQDNASEIVQIITGNAQQVFNAVDDANYYYFVIKGKDIAPIFINLAIHDLDVTCENQEGAQGEADIDLLIYRYPLPTGPPLLSS